MDLDKCLDTPYGVGLFLMVSFTLIFLLVSFIAWEFTGVTARIAIVGIISYIVTRKICPTENQINKLNKLNKQKKGIK